MPSRCLTILRDLVSASWLAQFFRFSGVGIIATAAQYLILVTLVHLGSIRAAVASTIGFAMSSILNYLLNYSFTFRSNAIHAVAMPRFFSVSAAGLVINYALMALATERARWNYLGAQVATTVVVLVWNFSANRLWTFRDS